jgi:hypothetical protein
MITDPSQGGSRQERDMTQSDIFIIAHQQRRERGISMSLALRQVYAVRRSLGMRQSSRGQVVSQQVDLGQWLRSMAVKDLARPGVLASYSIPTQ